MPRAVGSLLALLLLVGCGSEEAPEETQPARWTVKDGFIRAPDGRRAILRGANLAGAHKAAPYFGFHAAPDYAALRDHWGMTNIRLLILWAAIEPEKGKYDESYLDEVALRAAWARDAGLSVVLDMHQDVYGEGFATGGGDGAPRWTCDEAHYQAFTPASQWFLNYLDPNVQDCVDGFYASEELMDHYIEAWRRVAARLADNDAVVGFDVMNEPHWGSSGMSAFDVEKLQPFYEKVVPKVREVAPEWLAFLEPGASRNLGNPTSFEPFPFEGVVYAPHSYNSSAEQGQGFDPKARAQFVSNIELLAEEARSLGAALWIGEYGGPTEKAGITEYMDANYDGAAAVAAANTYWAYDANSHGYGMLEDDHGPKAVLEDVLIRPAPHWIAGDPVSWDFDPTSRKFTLTWHPDAHVKTPTVIRVPDRVYPNGFEVACDGCVTEATPGSLAVTAGPKGDPAVLEISGK
ncbi:MAG: cellulase family glycosylhydrolase [Polyangiaceae bacterium]